MGCLKKLLVTVGFILVLLACCFRVPDDKWYIPALIALAGAVFMYLAILAERLQYANINKLKQCGNNAFCDSDKSVVKIQSSNYAGEFEQLYNELILDEIWS